MARTTIEWTATYLDDGTVIPGYTFNPWIGCQKVSTGCAHCYAERDFTRKPRWAKTWGPPETSERLRTSEANWRKPFQWQKRAAHEGKAAKVFCASLADVFEDNLAVAEWRVELFENIIYKTPYLKWLLLTKRPERASEFFDNRPELLTGNVWMGTSVEDQETANKRIPELLRIPAVVRFLSCEPLLGPIPDINLDHIHWVIVGAESGPGGRPMDEDWVREIRDQCIRAGVPLFYKQRVEGGKKVSMPELDGRVWGDMPKGERLT